MIPLLVNRTSDLPEGFNEPVGMILMGSFLVRSFKSDAVPDIGPGQYSFPCPTLTVGAELGKFVSAFFICLVFCYY
jgi:hypothetical protein